MKTRVLEFYGVKICVKYNGKEEFRLPNGMGGELFQEWLDKWKEYKRIKNGK